MTNSLSRPPFGSLLLFGPQLSIVFLIVLIHRVFILSFACSVLKKVLIAAGIKLSRPARWHLGFECPFSNEQ